MSTVYIDTSVWIALLTGEPSAARVKDKFEAMASETFCLSDWVITEFASALSLKCRRLELVPKDMERNHLSFERLTRPLTNLAIAPVDYMKAASLCREHTRNLRASDALHLAIALRHKCKIMFSLDDVLNKEAKRHGLALVQI